MCILRMKWNLWFDVKLTVPAICTVSTFKPFNSNGYCVRKRAEWTLNLFNIINEAQVIPKKCVNTSKAALEMQKW